MFEEYIAKARAMRKAADDLIERIADSAAQINENMGVIREWKPGNYTANVSVRMYDGDPYKCVQTHDSTSDPSWNPTVESLWMQYHGTTRDTARPFKHPKGAHDMYLTGEYMIWTDGTIKRAKMDTIYSPDEYAQAWETV